MPFYENMPMDEILKLPKLEVRMLYHSNYWDGPLSGMCVLCLTEEDDDSEEEGRFWFDILIETDPVPCPKEEWCDQKIEEERLANGGQISLSPTSSDEEWGCPPDQNGCYTVPAYRYYGIYRLDAETLAEEERRHKLFQTLVGRHCDYDEDEVRTLGKDMQSPQNQAAYYEMAKEWPKLDLTKELIGYFIR